MPSIVTALSLSILMLAGAATVQADEVVQGNGWANDAFTVSPGGW